MVVVSPQFIPSPRLFEVPFAAADSGSQLWNTTWGGTGYEKGKAVAIASDGVYVAGYTWSFGAGGYDAFLVKYDTDGSQLWNTTWGGASNELGYGVAVAGDGVYFTGSTESFGAGDSDALLVKYDSGGNQLWNTTWGEADTEYGSSVAVVGDHTVHERHVG